ncbi:MAG: hypothetical protein M1826_005308 [Phylliscum demangeonii]|nr:MAG: hypothetical protein M1826_005308 [Phylliscum demangeonii]
MALRAFARRETGALTKDVLRTVPAWVGMRIWREIKHRGVDTFQLWTLFLSAYPHAWPDEDRTRSAAVPPYPREADTPPYPREAGTPLYVREAVTPPDKYPGLETGTPADEYPGLETYTAPTVSGCYQWLTSLTIGIPALTRAEAVALSRLPNLWALHIFDRRVEPVDSAAWPDDAVDDAVVGAWSICTSDHGAFSRLRALSLHGFPAVTLRVLDTLSSFPALDRFEASGASLPWCDGWEPPAGWKAELSFLLSRYGTGGSPHQ